MGPGSPRVAAAVAAFALAGCWLTSPFDGLVTVDAGGEDAAPPPDDVVATGTDGEDEGTNPPEAGASDAGADGGSSDSSSGDATPAPDAGCLATDYVGSVMFDKPVAYWRLDDAVGSKIAKDTIGKYDGTYLGGITLGVPGVLAGDTAAMFDGALGTYVKVGADPSFLGVKPFSVEAWIYPTTLDGSYRGILSNESPTTMNRGGYLLFVHQTGDVGFERWNGGVSNPTIAHTLAINAWYHVVGTFSGTKLVLYLNGVAVDTDTTNIVQVGSSYTFDIGILYSAALDPGFAGKIDEVAVYDHALDPRCVLAHYHLGKGLPP